MFICYEYSMNIEYPLTIFAHHLSHARSVRHSHGRIFPFVNQIGFPFFINISSKSHNQNVMYIFFHSFSFQKKNERKIRCFDLRCKRWLVCVCVVVDGMVSFIWWNSVSGCTRRTLVILINNQRFQNFPPKLKHKCKKNSLPHKEPYSRLMFLFARSDEMIFCNWLTVAASNVPLE